MLCYIDRWCQSRRDGNRMIIRTSKLAKLLELKINREDGPFRKEPPEYDVILLVRAPRCSAMVPPPHAFKINLTAWTWREELCRNQRVLSLFCVCRIRSNIQGFGTPTWKRQDENQYVMNLPLRKPLWSSLIKHTAYHEAIGENLRLTCINYVNQSFNR